MAVRVNEDWPFKGFRSPFIAQIEESVRLSRMLEGISGAQIEELVLLKAHTRDEYLALVTKLIVCIKEYNKYQTSQEMAGGVNMGPHGHINAGAPPGTGDNQGGIQDLLNALQNLTLHGGQQGQPPGPPQQGDERS